MATELFREERDSLHHNGGGLKPARVASGPTTHSRSTVT